MSRYLKAPGAAILALGLFAAGALMLSPQSGRSDDPDGSDTAVATSLVAAPVVAEDDLEATITRLQERLSSAPEGDWLGFATLGAAYLQKARIGADPNLYPLAERAFRRSIRIEPDNLIAALGMGELANARHEFAVSKAWAARALEVNPVSPVAHGILGDAQVELGSYAAGFKTYRRMADILPGLPSYARVAHARELSGDVGGAISAMRRALLSAGGEAYPRAWAATELAKLYLHSGATQKAKRLFEQALASAPSFAPARFGLARIDVGDGRLRRAVSDLRRVVRLAPSPAHVALLGDVYRGLGRYESAEAQYDLVVAQEKLRRASGVRPDVEIPLFFADHARRLGRALEIVEEQYRTRKSIYVADAYAWTLHALGRDEEAWPLVRAALRLGTRDALLHYHAGEIAASLGRAAQARMHLSLALEIDPAFSLLHSDAATDALRKLRGSR